MCQLPVGNWIFLMKFSTWAIDVSNSSTFSFEGLIILVRRICAIFLDRLFYFTDVKKSQYERISNENNDNSVQKPREHVKEGARSGSRKKHANRETIDSSPQSKLQSIKKHQYNVYFEIFYFIKILHSIII